MKIVFKNKTKVQNYNSQACAPYPLNNGTLHSLIGTPTDENIFSILTFLKLQKIIFYFNLLILNEEIYSFQLYLFTNITN